MRSDLYTYIGKALFQCSRLAAVTDEKYSFSHFCIYDL